MARSSPLIVTAIQISSVVLVYSSNKNVVFESALLDGAVWESHFPVAMLDTLFPLALIDRAVGPKHFTISLSFVINIVAFVNVTALPVEDAVAVFAVLLILSIILVARIYIDLFLPFTSSVLEALFELADVDTS